MNYIIDTVQLRKAMAENKMYTIKDLSKATNISRNTIGQVVKGKTYPSSIVMNAIVSALKLDGEKAGRIFFAKNLPKK